MTLSPRQLEISVNSVLVKMALDTKEVRSIVLFLNLCSKVVTSPKETALVENPSMVKLQNLLSKTKF
jgi:hypothetical protein